VLREHEDALIVLHAGVREGMTDVYVALKRLRRKGPPRSLRSKRKTAPSFDQSWAEAGALGLLYPDRVKDLPDADR